MSIFIYQCFIRILGFGIWIISFFSLKAAKWIKGRKNSFQNLINKLEGNNKPIIWFHTASLGEFEQARPVLESIKQEYNNYFILVSFFSPSGFEVRKDYEKADYICYIPLDTNYNSKKWISIVNPAVVIWTRYDFWFNHLRQINKNKIPAFLISATFRENQWFFKPYGKKFKEILKNFEGIYLQDQSSYNVLSKNRFKKIILTGDTRFDRVLENLSETLDVRTSKIIKNFKSQSLLFIIGSSWKNDLEIILPYLLTNHENFKTIIAPHEIHENELKELISMLPKSKRLSEITDSNSKDLNFLIIDSVGILSRLYFWADIAYIGGGFGDGSPHNILEPAVYGIPIIVGKNFKKSWECVELAKQKGIFGIKDSNSFTEIFTQLLKDENLRKITSEILVEYVNRNSGAVKKIMEEIRQKLN